MLSHDLNSSEAMFDLTCINRLVYERISLVCNLVKLGMSYLGCSAVIPQLAVTIPQFISGWRYSRELSHVSTVEPLYSGHAL